MERSPRSSVPYKILAKLIIRQIFEAVDQRIRQEQAGFREWRGCTDQIFTLHNIVKQCTEWQMHLYINYVHFEKAFDSIHRESRCRILKAYGIAQYIVLVFNSFCNNFTCRVRNSKPSLGVKTGVKQGYPMSAFSSTWKLTGLCGKQPRTNLGPGIRWTLLSTLEDLDFADDLALILDRSAWANENHPS